MSPDDVTLTIDERDDIENAKLRTRNAAAVIGAALTAMAETNAEIYPWHPHVRDGIVDLINVILEDVRAIDTALDAADARRNATETPAKTKRGAK